MSDKKQADPQGEYFMRLIAFAGISILAYNIYLKALSSYEAHKTQIDHTVTAMIVLIAIFGIIFLYNKVIDLIRGGKKKIEGEIFVGKSIKTNEPIYINEQTRQYHTEVIGSTGSGKTEGVILPWIFDDIENNRGIVIIDGKPEDQFLRRLYGKIVEAGRADDFLLFSLSKPTQSNSFNPFFGSAFEITERVFSSYTTENSYYRAIQYSGLMSVLKLIQATGRIPKPGLVRELLRHKILLKHWTKKINDPELYSELESILELSPDKFQENFSGLLSYLETFTKCEMAPLLNQDVSEINFEDILLKRKVVYFQLPTLDTPTLASTLGRFAIQSLVSASGKLQGKGCLNSDKLFSVYLDDFNDYMYPEFISVANKTRSAGLGIVFSHQSLADLNKVSPDFKDIIVENTNNKILLKINDPEAAEFFARYIGTLKTQKTTFRKTKDLIGTKETGDESVRDVEEYDIHPNVFKTELATFEGVAVILQNKKPRLIGRIRCEPVGPVKLMVPKNRPMPPTYYLDEAKMFGDKNSTSPLGYHVRSVLRQECRQRKTTHHAE